MVSAVDNCNSQIHITQIPESGHLLPGSSEMVFNAIDSSENISTCTSIVRVITGHQIKNPNIKIYPNPSTGKIVIENAKGRKITITNPTGLEIINNNVITNYEELYIDLKGPHIIRLDNDGKIEYVEFVIFR